MTRAERSAPARTQPVNCARHQFLAAAAFAFDQHGERHSRGGFYRSSHVSDGLADTEQARHLGTDDRPASELDGQANRRRHCDCRRLEQRAVGGVEPRLGHGPTADQRADDGVAKPHGHGTIGGADSHVTTVCPSSAARRAAAVRSSWPRRASTIVPGVDTPATSTALPCNRPCSNWQTDGSAARGSSCAWQTRRTATRSSSMGPFSTLRAPARPTPGLPGDERAGVWCHAQRAPLRLQAAADWPRARRPAPGRAARVPGPAAGRRAASASRNRRTGRFGQRDAPADQPLDRQEQLVVVIERDPCAEAHGPLPGVNRLRASTAPLTTSMRSCAIAASSGQPVMASCTSARAPRHIARFQPCPDTRERHARNRVPCFAGGDLHCVGPARLPAQTRDQQCDQPRRWRRIEHARGADGRGQEVLGVDERRLANPLLCRASAAPLDQAGRVCGRRQPAGFTPPVPRLSQVASCARPALKPRSAAGRPQRRVPARARPGRAAHVPLGRRRAAACRPVPRTRSRMPAASISVHGIGRVGRRKVRCSFVHRRDLAAQAQPRRRARQTRQAVRFPTSQSPGRAATGANNMPGDTQSARASSSAAAPRGCARPGRGRPCRHDVQYDRPGRVGAAQSHQQPRQSLAFGHLPAGTLAEHQQLEAVEQCQPRGGTTVVTPHGRLEHGRIARARSPAAGLTRKATPRRAPTTAGDGVHRPDARPAGPAVLERRQHVRLERPRASRIPHPGPGVPRGSEAPSSGSVGISPRDRRRGSGAWSPQTTPWARRNAGRLAA